MKIIQNTFAKSGEMDAGWLINSSIPLLWSFSFSNLIWKYSHVLSFVVQSLSHVWLFVTPWTAARQASCPSPSPWSLLKLMSIELVMLSNQLVLCYPLLLLLSVFSSIRVFSNESALRIRWPKYWSFSFSINPSSEHSWLSSFRIDWFDLLRVQGTLRSLLQHHSSKASILTQMTTPSTELSLLW